MIVLILFLLPVFPFSILVNYLLSKLGAKIFSLTIFILFICGNLLLMQISIDSQVLLFFTLFTILFYSFRLLGVNDLKTFILYLYPIISSLAILWNLVGGDSLEFMAVKIPILISFLTLYCFLSGQFALIHKKSINGLGSPLPRFSILFVLSIIGISSSMFFLGFEMLEIEFLKLNIFYGISLVVSWIFISWSSIKVIEWLIYGDFRKNIIYKDLNNTLMIFLIFMIMITAGFFLFYSTGGLI